ncbi:ABC transporter permease [Paenibacillus nasutitermitis]|uniref:ABC transporter permease n=1 Tax=Paenibacillus nasutitermitis TaxID=1652958 RepID=UPI001E497054|nr:ABC transporter permease [Paenibacillus nasutitermitis]
MGKGGRDLVTRLATRLTAVGILIMLLCSQWISSVQGSWQQLNGAVGTDKWIVNRNVVSADGGLTLAEFERLGERWGQLPITAIARTTEAADGGPAAAAIADIVGVSAGYQNFHQLRIMSGSFFDSSAAESGNRVAVIQADVAERLFRSGDAVGRSIDIGNTPFTVIGVYDGLGTVLEQMSDDGVPDIIVPVSALLAARPDLKIQTLELAADPDSAIQDEQEIHSALQSIGHRAEWYEITNMKRIDVARSQWSLLMRFINGGIAILLCIKLLMANIGAARMFFKEKTAIADWTDVIRSERAKVAVFGAAIVGWGACIAAVWLIVRFGFQIPPDWLPDQLIDFRFYTDKIKSLWQARVEQYGYVPSSGELLGAAAGRFVSLLFLAGMLLGLPSFLIGLRLAALHPSPPAAIMERLALLIAVATALSFAVIRMSGMDYTVGWTDIAVIAALFLSAHHQFQLKKERFANVHQES